jgi:P-type Ca2+ transporter type 2C
MSLKDSSQNLYYSYSVEETFKNLSVNESGLSSEEASKRLNEFGFNEIEGKNEINPFFIFIKQFNSFLIYILLVAALIAWFYGKIIDVYVILAVVILNSIMGFIQEYRAEKAIQALKNIIVPTAKAYRNGEIEKIDAKNLVPGDVIFLEEGDRIPADARIFEARNFRTVESSLTGESNPTNKKIEKIEINASLGDRKNMVWMGTFVAGGEARAVVVATGSKTIFGEIAKDIDKIEKRKSHFEEKIDRLVKQMAIIAVAGSFLIFMVGYFLKQIEFQEILFFTIASLVSGIPEGLPAMLVIILAVGASKMAKRNAIVRRLSATETLGVTTAICTDKTGTITMNTMNIREILFKDGSNIEVSGDGWIPYGDFYENGNRIIPLENSALAKLLHISSICNSANLIKDETSKERYKIIGDPTEAALIVLAEKAGLKKDVLREKKIDDMAFNSNLKYRASLLDFNLEKNHQEIYVVGAPELIINRASFFIDKNGKKSKLTEQDKKDILTKIEKLTGKAMRTIALAYKSVNSKHKVLSDDIVNEIIFVGTVGMIDPPKPEIKESVLKAKKAGIRVIMLTGDHKGTAIAISKEVGIIDEENNEEKALTENELQEMTEHEFRESVRKVNVFARMTPNMKLRIAEALQEDGHVVAMTGDGVNDAPALKKSDIGIAMGIRGTDVARESSEIILADDNFISIINAVEEGRIVFTNTRQASSFLVTTNFAEHTTLIISLFLFAQIPLLPTQILWLNLVTDGIAGFPLTIEPGHGKVLNEPPRKKDENILSKEIIPFSILMMSVMAILTIFFFDYHLKIDNDIDKARTAAFTVMAFTQLFNVLNMRSIKRSIFELKFFSNKYIPISLSIAFILQMIALYFLAPVFNFVELSFFELLFIFFLSSFVLWFGELYKLMKYGKGFNLLKNN